MALRDTLIPAVLNTGLDTGKDPKVVSQGLLRLENSVFDYRGQLRKRHGLRQITGVYPSTHVLTTYNDNPVMYGSDMRVYNTGDNSFDTIVSSLSLLNVDLQLFLSKPNVSYGQPQIIQFGDIYAISLIKYDNLASTLVYRVYTYNRHTGELLDTYGVAAGPTRLVLTSAALYYFEADTSMNNLYWGTISSAGIFSAPVVIPGAASTSSTGEFDVCAFSSAGTSIFLAHQTAAGDCEPLGFNGSTWTVGTTISTGGNCGVVGVFALSASVACLLYEHTATKTIFARGYNNYANYVISSATVFTYSTPTVTNLTGCGVSSVGYVYVSYHYGSGFNLRGVYRNTYEDGGGGTGSAGTPALFKYGIEVRGKPFVSGSGDIHIPCIRADDTSGGEAAYLIVGDGGDVEALIMFGSAYEFYPFATAVGDIASGQYITCFVKKTGEDTTALYIANIITDARPMAIEVNNVLALQGAAMLEWDGQHVVEHGFTCSPKTTLAQTVGGSLTATSTYGYVAVYEWFNNQGQRYQSAQSPVSSFTLTGGNQSFDVTVRSLGVTMKSDVNIVLYRTLANGSVYYRCQTALNDPTVRSQVIADSYADSSINTNEILYTQGGVLNNYPLSPHDVATVHQYRHFVYDKENSSIKYSKAFSDSVGIEHSPFLEIKIPSEGGEVTALASYMDRLIAFKESRIFACAGQGLSLVGAGGNYSDFVAISEAVGCVNPRTVVLTPLGLMFESLDGIYVLNKTLQVQLVSDPVKYHHRQIDVVRALIIPEDNYVIFLPEAYGDVALVYNYVQNQWGTFTKHYCSDACVAGGSLYLKYDTSVWAQDRTLWRDGGSDVIQRIRTGWFSFAKITGVQFVRSIMLEGQNISDHKIRLKTAYDEPVFVDNQVFNTNTLENMDIDDHYGVGLSSAYSDNAFTIEAGTSIIECSKIMLEITDEEDGVVSLEQGFSLTAITFLVAIEDGFKRLGSGRRF